MPTEDGWPEPSDFDTWEAFEEANLAEHVRRNKLTFWAAIKPNTCWSCGFCGFRTSGTQDVVIVLDADMRQSGVLPNGKDLWCWQERTHLPRETDESEETFDQRTKFYNNLLPKRSAAIREVLDKPRPACVRDNKWQGYRDGLSIKEHYDEWQTMQLEEMRQKQAEMLNEFAETQLEITKLIDATVADQLTLTANASIETGRVNKIVVGLTAAAICLAAATLIFPNGIPGLTISNDARSTTVVTATPQSTPSTAGSLP